MAAQTLGTVPYEAGISVPVDGAIRFDAIGRIALAIVILAIFVFDCGRISQRIRRGGVAPKECRHKREAARNDKALHLHLQSGQFSMAATLPCWGYKADGCRSVRWLGLGGLALTLRSL